MSSRMSFAGFLLFAGLGGIGTAVHYSVLVVGVQVLGWSALSASMAGFVCGAVTNFLLSHHVAFRSRARHRETAPRFFAVAIAGFAINAFVMWAATVGAHVPYIVAQVLATCLVLGCNYACNATWTFGGRRGDQ